MGSASEKTNNGSLRWALGIIIILVIQLLGVAFAAGIVWQKLGGVSEQLSELKTVMKEQWQNQYTKHEAANDFKVYNDWLIGIQSRITQLEKLHLKDNG